MKALVGAFFVIVKTDCETDGSSAALVNIESTLQCKIDRAAAAAVSGDHKIQNPISYLQFKFPAAGLRSCKPLPI